MAQRETRGGLISVSDRVRRAEGTSPARLVWPDERQSRLQRQQKYRQYEQVPPPETTCGRRDDIHAQGRRHYPYRQQHRTGEESGRRGRSSIIVESSPFPPSRSYITRPSISGLSCLLASNRTRFPTQSPKRLRYAALTHIKWYLSRTRKLSTLLPPASQA